MSQAGRIFSRKQAGDQANSPAHDVLPPTQSNDSTFLDAEKGE
jgi:hypothetical protein